MAVNFVKVVSIVVYTISFRVIVIVQTRVFAGNIKILWYFALSSQIKQNSSLKEVLKTGSRSVTLVIRRLSPVKISAATLPSKDNVPDCLVSAFPPENA